MKPKKAEDFTINESGLLWRHDSQIAAMGVDIKNIYASIDRIENNHLAHIQGSMDALELKVDKIDEKITMADPLNKLLFKAIEFVLLGVLGAIIALIIKS